MSKRRIKNRTRRNLKKPTSLPGREEIWEFDDLKLSEDRGAGEFGTSPEISLANAKTNWFFGEWSELAQLDRDVIQHHQARDRLALLAASAHLQLGDFAKAQDFMLLALDWGCPKRIVSQVMIAGVHNTLGRVAALSEDRSRLQKHFNAAVISEESREKGLVSHARAVREMTRMGLLPQALILSEELSQEFNEQRRFRIFSESHVKVIGLEMDWLREKVLELQKKNALTSSHAIVGKLEKKQDASSVYSSEESSQFYGLNGLDRKLEAYINYDGGYFVELGANDGVDQSNTLYFEKERSWKGVLIEPILHNFLKCKKNRSPENSFSCAACVSFEYDKAYVHLTFSNLMTSPSELESDIDDPVAHAHSGRDYLKNDETLVDVLATAKTLNSILADAQAPYKIDLLSLDVEGAEIEVLKGIDHDKYSFKFILVECRKLEIMETYLKSKGYSLLDKLSQHDYLFINDEIDF